MLNANLYVMFDLTENSRKRIEDAINVMQDVIDGVGKCYGTYEGYGCLDEAISELKSILNGEKIY